jgi:predicted transcriptional regulator
MKHLEVIDNVKVMLNRAGYNTSEICSSRRSCIDFAARKEDNLIFIKIFADIRSIPLREANELKKISKFFPRTSFFLSLIKKL